MFTSQPVAPCARNVLRAATLLGSLLVALTAGLPAHAVTYITVQGHPNPVTLIAGETVTMRLDVSKPGGGVNVQFARDLTGAGKFDPAAPVFAAGSLTDGSGQDTDPTPGKIAFRFPIAPDAAAGPYVLHLEDPGDRSSLDLPGVTIVPKPEPQAISGRVRP